MEEMVRERIRVPPSVCRGHRQSHEDCRACSAMRSRIDKASVTAHGHPLQRPMHTMNHPLRPQARTQITYIPKIHNESNNLTYCHPLNSNHPSKASGGSIPSVSCHLIFIDLDVRDLGVEAISKSPIREGGGASLPVPPTRTRYTGNWAVKAPFIIMEFSKSPHILPLINSGHKIDLLILSDIGH